VSFLICLACGALAVRDPVFAVITIGAIGCFVIYVTGPQRMASIAIVVSFASLPAALPAGKFVGPVIIYVYEVLIVLAIIFLIPLAKVRLSNFLLPTIMFSAVMIAFVIGIMSDYELARVASEGKNLLIMVAGFVLAILVVRAGYLRQSIRVMVVVLWFSAIMLVASSLTGLRLAGRNQTLSSDAGADAVRLLTPTQTPALAALAALLVLSIFGFVRYQHWLSIGLPAFAVTILGFSRNTLIALAVATVLAVFVKFSWSTIGRVARMVMTGAAAVLVFTALLALLQRTGAASWVSEQSLAFSHRVFGGVSTTALAADPSTQYRLNENVNLWRAFGQSPILGHGLGYAYQPSTGPPDRFAATDGPYYAHNFYLWLLVKAGVFGMLAFIYFAFVPLLRAIRTASIEAKASAIVGASLLVICIVNPLPLGPANCLALGMTLGLAMAFSRPKIGHHVGEVALALSGPGSAPRFVAEPNFFASKVYPRLRR
jgi:O-antigen ligase